MCAPKPADALRGLAGTRGRAVYDFQAFPDKSIEPPPEPLPLRWNLDAIWGNGPVEGTTAVFAAAPAAAPDDATRLAKLLTSVPYYASLGKSAAFMGPNAPLSSKVFNLTTIVPQDYDGTFHSEQFCSYGDAAERSNRTGKRHQDGPGFSERSTMVAAVGCRETGLI